MADGRIIIDTEINSSGAEKGVKGLGGKLGSIAKTGIGAFASLIAASGTALVGLGTIGVKYNSEMEQYMSSFTTMLGSAEKATKHLDDLKKFAAKTPFELGDLAKASTTLQAFGTDVKDIAPDLKMLGDISLGNKEKFNSLALVFGQVQSQGKLMGQDLLQMINAGFNPLQIISEKTGKSMSELKDEMADGKISFEMVADAMKTATSEGGKFYNAMDGQSKTLVGQWSTLKDNIGALLGDMFTSVSDVLTNKILPALNGVVEKIQQAFSNGSLKTSIDTIAEGFGNLAVRIGEIIAAVLPKLIEGFAWLLDNGAGIATIIGTIAASVVAFKAAAIITGVVQSWQEAKVALALYKMTADGAAISQGVMNGVFTVWETIVALMTGEITLAAAATGLWTKATAALSAMWAANPIGIVIVAIVALVGAFIYLWNNCEGFRNFWINAWTMIKDGFIAGWNEMIAFFTETIPSWIESIKAWFGSLGEWFGTLWTNIKQFFIDGWNAIASFFTETIPLWIQQLSDWFSELPYRIGYALGFVLATIIQWGVDTWNYLVTNVPIWIDSIGAWFASLPGKIWTWLVDTMTKIVTWGVQMHINMMNAAGNAINAVINWFATLPSRIWEWLCNTISKIIAFRNDMKQKAAEAGQQFLDTLINKVQEIPGQIFDCGKNIVLGLWNGIKSMGGWIADKVGGFFGGIVDGAKASLGIHSPSRVFRDQVGAMMAKGVGVGFEDETSNIEDSMKRDLSNLVGKMKATVDYNVASTTAGVVARNTYKEDAPSNGNTEDIPEGSIFTVNNYMDSEQISQYTYKKVDGKFALAGKRVR